ncbi:MAG: aldehyde dehydrogenase [Chromatiaceae bacterium]|nr:aldehyde dehydrogenase [Chromatiaceae bacterium]
MRIKPFFPVFIVLVGVIVYAYYAPEDRPEKGLTTTPKEYMEMVEKSRAERLKREQKQEQEQAKVSR